MKLYAYEQTVSDPCVGLRPRHAGNNNNSVSLRFPSAPSLLMDTRQRHATIALPQLDTYTQKYAEGVMDAIQKRPMKQKTDGYAFGYESIRELKAAGTTTAEPKTENNNPHMTTPDTARADMKQLIPYLQKEHQPIWRHLMQNDEVLQQLCRTVLVSFTLLTATSHGDEAIATYAPLCRVMRKMDTLEKCIRVRDVRLKPLLKPPSVSGPTSEENKAVLESVMKCRVSKTKTAVSKTGTNSKQEKKEIKTCKVLRENQANNIVHLRVHSLFTLLPGRWIDSACLDAYLHVLARHFPKREQLFLISAEHDPEFKQLIDSTHCYNYLLLPLYANKHWTLAFINKPCAEIWYFNSDLTHGLQYGNVERQLAPYRHHFPTYHIEVVKVPEQIDTFSCGTFVAYFAYCLLFSPTSIEKLKGWNAETFRELILKQLCLSYLYD